MIVVDTNTIAYLLLPGDQTDSARRAYRSDPEWSAPLLWRSEFRNVLATSLRAHHLSLREASELMDLAAQLMAGSEYEVESRSVLELAATSSCSAYDCEFVALAQQLRVPLVTNDRRILRDFRKTATSLERFGVGHG